MEKATDIQSYIVTFPKPAQKQMQALRKCITENAPEARETISYGMPAFKQNKILLYFAAHKHHIGFYPTSSGIEHFKHEFASYKWSKGAIQFPIDQDLPFDLISRMVQFRVREDVEKANQKKKKK